MAADIATTTTTTTPSPDALISTADALRYWETVPATVDGMLGGTPQVAPHISRADLQGSRAFLARLGLGQRRGRARVGRALEGGAGIGRVTLGLLVDVADVVDVIEPVAAFTALLEGKPGVGRIFNVGMEDWGRGDAGGEAVADAGGAADGAAAKADDAFPPASSSKTYAGPPYDLVWNQLCVGQLTDAQLEAYLARCRAALAPGGRVCIKDNTTRTGRDVFDPTDSSVTRGEPKFRAIFRRAGLRVLRTEVQKAMPGGLYPIRMYALVPEEEEEGGAAGRPERGVDDGEDVVGAEAGREEGEGGEEVPQPQQQIGGERAGEASTDAASRLASSEGEH